MNLRLLLICLLLPASATLVACSGTDPDDDDVTPPRDDDDDGGDACDDDTECSFTSGLEICGDEGVCVQGDRNNSRDEAQLVEYNSAASLIIAPAGDVDWFRFNGTAGDLFRIATAADNPDSLDTVVTFYDAQGNEIAFNDDFERVGSVPPNSQLFSGVAQTGLHYFSVQDRRSWVNDPADPPQGGLAYGYDVAIVRAGAGAGENIGAATEPDDEAADANAFDLPEYRINYNFGGVLQTVGDADWWAIDVAQAETLRLYGFPNSGSAGSTAMTVYLPDAVSPIGTWVNPGWEEDQRAWIPILESGTYYVEVAEAGGGGGADTWYFLHGAKNEPEEGLPVESEPNGSESPEALALVSGPGNSEELTFWGRTHPSGDQDWFALTGEADDRVTVQFERTLHGESQDVRVRIVAPDGSDVVDVPWDGDEEAPISLFPLTSSGEHHVVIEAPDGVASGAGHYYQVRIGILHN